VINYTAAKSGLSTASEDVGAPLALPVYVRPEVVREMKIMLDCLHLKRPASFEQAASWKPNLLLFGPPGSGKSTATWVFANLLFESGYRVLWMHYRRLKPMCLTLMEPTSGITRYSAANLKQLETALQRFQVDVVFLDGLTQKADDLSLQAVKLLVAWFEQDPARARRFFLVTSTQFQIQFGIIEGLRLRVVGSVGWCFQELAAAVASDEVFNAVRHNLVGMPFLARSRTL